MVCLQFGLAWFGLVWFCFVSFMSDFCFSKSLTRAIQTNPMRNSVNVKQKHIPAASSITLVHKYTHQHTHTHTHMPGVEDRLKWFYRWYASPTSIHVLFIQSPHFQDDCNATFIPLCCLSEVCFCFSRLAVDVVVVFHFCRSFRARPCITVLHLI